MKILIVTNIHEPISSESTNGMERSTFDFLNSLHNKLNKDKDIGIEVITNRLSTLPNGFSIRGVSLAHCNADYQTFGDGVSKWNQYEIESKVFEALDNKRFDLIHDMSSSVTAAFFAKCHKTPYIRTLRLMPYHPIYQTTNKYSTASVYLSEYQLSFESIRKNRTHKIIRDFIDINGLNANKDKDPFCVSVGRIEHRKGHHIAASISKHMNLKLIIIGAPSDPQYQEYISKAFTHVEIVSEITRSTCLNLLSKAKYLIWTPTVPESNGRVVVEALKLGTPVIGPKNGAISDIVNFYHIKPELEINDEKYFIVEKLTSDWPKTEDSFISNYIDLYKSTIQ